MQGENQGSNGLPAGRQSRIAWRTAESSHNTHPLALRRER